MNNSIIQEECARRARAVNWDKGACQDDYEYATMTGQYAADRDHPVARCAKPARARRPVTFHLTLREQDRELLDRLARRMGCSRTETIARSLHLLETVHQREAVR